MTADDTDETALAELYRALLDAWNRRDAAGTAALFIEDAELIGFDGTQLKGRDAIEESQRQIFADHVTPTFVGKVLRSRRTGDGTALVRAISGGVPPGKDDIAPGLNNVQVLLASRAPGGRWLLDLYATTPAQFHGRPEEVARMTAELQELRPPDAAPALRPTQSADAPSEADSGPGVVDLDQGFNQLIGLKFDAVSGDEVVVRLPLQARLHQPHGIVHGGVWCAIVETAASIGAATWLGERGSVVGVANHTNFLRAAREGEVTGRAVPIHRGRLQQLWMVEITDADGRLLARGEVRFQNLESAAGLGMSRP